MYYQGDPRDLGLAVALLCKLRGWSQRDLSREAGLNKDTVDDCVQGTTRPTCKTLDRLAAAFAVEVSFFEQLAPVCGRIRLAYESATGRSVAGVLPAGGAAPGLEGKIGTAAVRAMAPFLLNLSQLDRRSPRAEDQAWAAAVWATLETRETE